MTYSFDTLFQEYIATACTLDVGWEPTVSDFISYASSTLEDNPTVPEYVWLFDNIPSEYQSLLN